MSPSGREDRDSVWMAQGQTPVEENQAQHAPQDTMAEDVAGNPVKERVHTTLYWRGEERGLTFNPRLDTRCSRFHVAENACWLH